MQFDVKWVVGLGMFCSLSASSLAQEQEKWVRWEDSNTHQVGYASSVKKNKNARWTVPSGLIHTDLIEVWGVGGGLVFNKKQISFVDWAIPPQYDDVGKHFSENLSAVVLQGKLGFIDRRNRFILPPRFEPVADLQGFSQGLAVVKMNGKFGFVDKAGNWVIEPVYEWADNFRDNLLASVKLDGKYGAIDLTGQLVVPCKYKLEEAMIHVPISNKEYRKAAKESLQKKENGAYDVRRARIDSVARKVNLQIHDPEFYPQPLHSDLVLLEEKEGKGVKVNETDSTWLLDPLYTDISWMDEHWLLVEKCDSLLGVADFYGRQVLPCRYASIEFHPQEACFIVQEDSLYGIYDVNGVEILPVCLDAVKEFADGKLPVWMNGIPGWVDVKGSLNDGFLDRIYRTAVEKEEAGKVGDAVQLYERILWLNPGYSLAYNNLGIIDLNREDYNKGMRKLKLAHKLDPDNSTIAHNLEQAKKDRKERRWNRVMKGFETAQVVLGVAATTYNAVEAAQGGSNFVDAEALMNGTSSSAATAQPSPSSMPMAAYSPAADELAREEEKLQQLLLQRQVLLNRSQILRAERSREGVRQVRRAGTSLRLNHGKVRPGQGNYGRGAGERYHGAITENRVELRNINKRIAICEQRIYALKEGIQESSYAERASHAGSVGGGSKKDNYSVNDFYRAQNTYMSLYGKLQSMQNRNGEYSTSSPAEINRARRDLQQQMRHIRQTWEARGKQVGNSSTMAMENWVP